MIDLDFVDGILKAINQGSKKGGASVLSKYIKCINNNEKPDKDVENFVIGCLSQVVDCYASGRVPDFDSIFCLSQTQNNGVKLKGRPSLPLSTKIKMEKKVLAKVEKLRSTGVTREVAFGKVADELAMSISAVEKCYDEWGEKHD